MFTGIVEELGTVHSFVHGDVGARLVIQCSTVLSDLMIGGSIAVNGVCLTAVEIHSGTDANGFAADLAPETMSRSNLGSLQTGCPVNLERPVTPATRLSGHIVQGHVDATAELIALEALGDGNRWLTLRAPRGLDRYLVEKGSITLDGISLTIASLDDAGGSPIVGVTIIPHTVSHTTLGSAKAGDRINVEVDVLAKHVEKLLHPKFQSKP
jgi:riboflavin synthase